MKATKGEDACDVLNVISTRVLDLNERDIVLWAACMRMLIQKKRKWILGIPDPDLKDPVPAVSIFEKSQTGKEDSDPICLTGHRQCRDLFTE